MQGWNRFHNYRDYHFTLVFLKLKAQNMSWLIHYILFMSKQFLQSHLA